MYRRQSNIILVLFVFLAGFWYCTDPISIGTDNDRLSFSADTVSFDTVFTTLGSVTQIITVRNDSRQSLTISSIEVAGQKSFFRLNIDGLPGNRATNLTLRGNDSLFIFVEVTIDPNNENNPVFIQDSIAFEVNGYKSHVLLEAYGQDVEIVRGFTQLQTTTWDAGKPYLLYDTVYVEQGHTLTIPKGTTLYCYKNFLLYVAGNIVVNGTVEEPVVFRGHRLDRIFTDLPYDKNTALWTGIVFEPGDDWNIFHNCEIRNAIYGIFAPIRTDDLKQTTKIGLYNSIVHNNLYHGLWGVNVDVVAHNTQITNSSQYAVFLAGGSVEFVHCTFANFYGYDSKRYELPCVLLSSIFEIEEKVYIQTPFSRGEVINSIIDGGFDFELILVEDVTDPINIQFKNSAVKMHPDLISYYSNRFENCTFNKSAKFLKTVRHNYDFSLDTISPMRDIANAEIYGRFPHLVNDLKGVSRFTDGKPDLGAYEFVLSEKE